MSDNSSTQRALGHYTSYRDNVTHLGFTFPWLPIEQLLAMDDDRLWTFVNAASDVEYLAMKMDHLGRRDMSRWELLINLFAAAQR